GGDHGAGRRRGRGRRAAVRSDRPLRAARPGAPGRLTARAGGGACRQGRRAQLDDEQLRLRTAGLRSGRVHRRRRGAPGRGHRPVLGAAAHGGFRRWSDEPAEWFRGISRTPAGRPLPHRAHGRATARRRARRVRVHAPADHAGRAVTAGQLESAGSVAATTWRARLRTDELLRGSAFIMATSVVTSLIGYAFWLLVDHSYPPAVSGAGAAAASLLQASALLASAGAGAAMMEWLPRCGTALEWRRRLTAGL